MKVKVKVLITAIVAFCLMLAGCSSSKTSSNASSKDGKVTINWFLWASNDVEAKPWKKILADFEKENPNIKVNLQTAPWNEYWSKLQTQVASGTAPDVVSMQSLHLPGFTSALAPLDDYIKKDSTTKLSDFNQPILKNLSSGGKTLVIPYDFGSQVVYYNKDLFKKYNVPFPKPGWTWQEFADDVKKLTNGQDYGFVPNGYPDYWLSFVLSNGGHYLKNGKYDINNPQAVESVQNLANFVKNNQTPKLVSTSDTTWAMQQFLKGNVAMDVDGPWDVVWYKTSGKFDFGIAPMPVGSKDSVSISAGSGFGISKTSKNPDAAYKLIKYLTSVESGKYLGSQGRAYPARDLARPEYFKQVPEDFKPALDYADQHTIPYAVTKTWAQAEDVMYKAMIPILNGEVPVKKGLDDLQKQLEGIQ